MQAEHPWHAWPVSQFWPIRYISLDEALRRWPLPRRRAAGELRVPLGELCPGLGEVVAGRGYAPRSPGE